MFTICFTKQVSIPLVVLPFPKNFFKTKDTKAKVWWKALSNKEKQINLKKYIYLMVSHHTILDSE